MSSSCNCMNEWLAEPFPVSQLPGRGILSYFINKPASKSCPVFPPTSQLPISNLSTDLESLVGPGGDNKTILVRIRGEKKNNFVCPNTCLSQHVCTNMCMFTRTCLPKRVHPNMNSILLAPNSLQTQKAPNTCLSQHVCTNMCMFTRTCLPKRVRPNMNSILLAPNSLHTQKASIGHRKRPICESVLISLKISTLNKSILSKDLLYSSLNVQLRIQTSNGLYYIPEKMYLWYVGQKWVHHCVQPPPVWIIADLLVQYQPNIFFKIELFKMGRCLSEINNELSIDLPMSWERPEFFKWWKGCVVNFIAIIWKFHPKSKQNQL